MIAAVAGDDDLALDLHSLFDLGLRRLTDCLAMFVDEQRKRTPGRWLAAEASGPAFLRRPTTVAAAPRGRSSMVSDSAVTATPAAGTTVVPVAPPSSVSVCGAGASNRRGHRIGGTAGGHRPGRRDVPAVRVVAAHVNGGRSAAVGPTGSPGDRLGHTHLTRWIVVGDGCGRDRLVTRWVPGDVDRHRVGLAAARAVRDPARWGRAPRPRRWIRPAGP